MIRVDKICIEDLEVYAYHGVYPEENKLGQPFVLSAELSVDTERAAGADDLKQSVNYGEVCLFMRDWMQQHTFQLIETVADRLARAILLAYPLVHGIRLEVKKPHAPVPMNFRSVSVVVERKWHTVFVGIGSNMGNREAYIRNAMLMLNEQADCEIEKGSSLFVTAPYGYTEQPEFLNGCLQVRTLQSPEQFLETLHRIEYALGRERTIHWGPRTIDLDILLYDDMVLHTETLSIPHIDMQNRLFVLKPLDEIAGYMWHPVLQKTIHQLCAELEQK